MESNSSSYSYIQNGKEIWYKNSVDSSKEMPYLISKIKSKNDKIKKCVLLNGESVDYSKTLPYKNSSKINIDDISSQENINEMDILNNLINRFSSKIYFTNISDNLLFLNPYINKEQIFNNNSLLNNHKQINSNVNNNFKNQSYLYKNIFQILNKLKESKVSSQSILIQGESCTGKSEIFHQTIKYILNYFQDNKTNINPINRQNHNLENENINYNYQRDKINDLGNKIFACNTVLEAFGNAKIINSENSTRILRYIKLKINKRFNNIIGAETYGFLLDKHRITNFQSNPGNNFNIFYYLLNCGKSDFLKKLFLFSDDLSEYQYLKRDNIYIDCSLYNKNKFKELNEALLLLGFTNEEIETMFKILSSILLFGNTGEIIDDKNQIIINICKLLDIDNREFISALINNEYQNNNINIDEIEMKKNTFINELYNQLFLWIINKINNNINENVSYEKEGEKNIFIFDYCGFENNFIYKDNNIIHINSLEQLFINYINELILYFYLKDYYNSNKEGEEYIPRKLIKEYNNKKDILHIIHYLLDELKNISKDSDIKEYIQNIEQNIKNNDISKKKLKKIQNYKIIKNINNNSGYFLIHHSCENIIYNTNEMVEKNMNNIIPWNLLDCLLKSNNAIIRNIYKNNRMNSISITLNSVENRIHTNYYNGSYNYENIINNEIISLSEEFLYFVREIKKEIKQSQKNYIICLKSNQNRMALNIIPKFVFQQIKYFNLIFGTKAASQNIFPISLKYFEFYNKYKILQKEENIQIYHDDYKEGCKNIIKDISKENKSNIFEDEKLILFDAEKILMKEEIYNILENKRYNIFVKYYINGIYHYIYRKFFQNLQKYSPISNNFYEKCQNFINIIQKVIVGKCLNKIIDQAKSKCDSKRKINENYSEKNFHSSKYSKENLNSEKDSYSNNLNISQSNNINSNRNLKSSSMNKFEYEENNLEEENKKNSNNNSSLNINSSDLMDNNRVKSEKSFGHLESYKSPSLIEINKVNVSPSIKDIQGVKESFELLKEKLLFYKLLKYKKYIKTLYIYSSCQIIPRYYFAMKGEIIVIQKYIKEYFERINIITRKIDKNINKKFKVTNDIETKINSILFPYRCKNSKQLKNGQKKYPRKSNQELLYDKIKNKNQHNNDKNMSTLDKYKRYKELKQIYKSKEIIKKNNKEEEKDILDTSSIEDKEDNFNSLNKLIKMIPNLSIRLKDNSNFGLLSNSSIFYQANNDIQYDNKIYFLSKIIDIDILTDISNDDEINELSWIQDYKKIYEYNLFNKTPILKIYMSDTHIMLVNNLGNIFLYGYNNKGQCGITFENSERENINVNNNYVNSDVALTFYQYFKENFGSVKDAILGDGYTLILNNKGNLYSFGNSVNSDNINSSIIENMNNSKNYSNINEPNIRSIHGKGDINLYETKTNELFLNIEKNNNNNNYILYTKGRINTSTSLDFNKINPIKIFFSKKIKISQISCGYNFYIILSKEGKLYSGGSNTHGELGTTEKFSQRLNPGEIVELSKLNEKIIQISCGFKHAIALTSNNSIYGWGNNTFGQIFSEKLSKRSEFIKLDFSQNKIVQIAAGFRSSFILNDNHEIFYFGVLNKTQKNTSGKPKKLYIEEKNDEYGNKNNFVPVKINSSWNKQMSLFYVIFADIRNISFKNGYKKNKNDNDKIKNILHKISYRWTCDTLKVPFDSEISQYFTTNYMEKPNKLIKNYFY